MLEIAEFSKTTFHCNFMVATEQMHCYIAKAKNLITGTVLLRLRDPCRARLQRFEALFMRHGSISRSLLSGTARSIRYAHW